MSAHTIGALLSRAVNFLWYDLYLTFVFNFLQIYAFSEMYSSLRYFILHNLFSIENPYVINQCLLLVACEYYLIHFGLYSCKH